MYQRGDVVLISFPFTDLTGTKTRPVVVVSGEEFEKRTKNIIVAMITSVAHDTPYDYELRDWRGANLLSPSWVRAKLATLEPKLVRYKPDTCPAEELVRCIAPYGLESA